MPALLQVRDLHTVFEMPNASVAAVRGISFDLDSGQTVGVLGESGSGKSTLALSLLQLLPSSGRIVRGSVTLRGQELVNLNEARLRAVRGAELAIVFQEPAMCLSPVMRAGVQIANVLRAHRAWSRKRCRQETESLLEQVGLSDTSRIYDAYPHELSSGQQQRIAIAQAIACRPLVVIADEPTANLDSTTRAHIVALFAELKRQLGIAFIFITHNPALLAGFADRVMVMYAGQVVEEDEPARLYSRPRHPYTQTLVHSVPNGRSFERAQRFLAPIVGNPPDTANLAAGCAFEPRCLARVPLCRTRIPDIVEDEPGHYLRCFNGGRNRA